MDDLISRQAVLKLLSTMPPEETTTKAMLIQSVKQLPSAESLEAQVAYYKGLNDGIEKCTEALKKFNDSMTGESNG